MKHPKGQQARENLVFTVRCPYCAEGDQFRPMIGLNGSEDGAFFCSKCHHLARPADPAFKCVCANCRNLDRTQTRSA
jgi:hypothetical protein